MQPIGVILQNLFAQFSKSLWGYFLLKILDDQKETKIIISQNKKKIHLCVSAILILKKWRKIIHTRNNSSVMKTKVLDISRYLIFTYKGLIKAKFNQHPISNRMVYNMFGFEEKTFPLWEKGPITKIRHYGRQRENSWWTQSLKYF